ncbi:MULTISPECIES: hypothetical protein [Enterobacterales]|jgi:hypothetical protein|uniref:Uncharacterized protein n=2 Tax=Providencia TaxID=586 RepID=A0A899NGI8_PROST|nr:MULTISPECIES: hypothetical protein [Enterobacterales]ELR5098747.1 hypothetical protein [Providencia rettgeri]ELR5188452.1 hypothetical protein [Providencia rettgeri]ELR5301967.1 hypothetical protein [Providencia stuartii]MBG5984893.1 hypothetical protein [Proteus vulgaris]MBJ9973148.1 hypothetical protein [Providencia rettgeri]
MKTEQIDIKLYLQRQSSCGLLKFTRLMDCILTPPLISFLIMALLFSIAHLIIMPKIVDELLFIPLCFFTGGCVCLLAFVHLYYSCVFPRLCPLLEVSEIEALCSKTFSVYQEMGCSESIQKSGIDYLDTLIREGIPMNYRHRRKINALVEADERDSKLNALSQTFESAIEKTKRSYSRP